ncbi:D-methionine transport system ATP-binding protein [Carboxydocella thermautotrophica]|nr:D-methionine transport system ATP-binding protein [Carboxydocella thermautotrophica]
MIRITELSKVFQGPNGPVQALKNINLSVSKGEIAGIIGYSGAGKSTLIRCVNLLETPTTGTIVVDGQEITSLRGEQLRQARRKMGMIFQHFNLLSSRTVRENIAFPLEIAGVPRAEIKKRVDELLELVGLTDRADNYPAQLSGGQKQRVGIARALASNPSVLLCDEATSALDPATTRSILQLLLDINQRLGLTILLITHEMDVIKEICDTVYVMEAGEIIESGPVLDVFAHPTRETTRAFIESLYQLDLPSDFYRQIVHRPGFHRLVRLVFTGVNAAEPIVATLGQKFAVTVNIMAGNIDYIKGQPLGILTLDISGDSLEVEKALSYLHTTGLKVEVLEYEF